MTSLSNNSEVTISTVEGKLFNVNFKVAEAEARLKLFNKLKARGMCTKDIFRSAKLQLRSKRVTTRLDRKAISRDMSAKIKDASAHLVRLKQQKSKAREEFLTALQGWRFILRKKTKETNKETRAYK